MRRRAGAVLLLAVGLATAVAVNGAAAQEHSLSELRRVANTEFPAIAARVNGHPISGQYLSYSVALIQQQSVARGQPASFQSATKQAIDRLVNRQVMIDAAERHGVRVSDSEVSAYLQAQVDRAADAPAEQYSEVLALNGNKDLSAYAADPRVRQHVRELLMMKKLVDSLTARNPRFDWLAYRDHLRTQAKVELYYSAP